HRRPRSRPLARPRQRGTSAGAGGGEGEPGRRGVSRAASLRFLLWGADGLSPRAGALWPPLLHPVPPRRWHGGVRPLCGSGAAVLVRPVEELEHRPGLGGVALLLVHQDVGGAGDGPATLARLVDQQDVEVLAFRPVGTAGRCLERRAVRLEERAGAAFELDG